MFFLKLGLRNVTRRYGRTTLSMVSIVMGVFIVILGRGFISGTTENIIRAQIDSVSGHVIVRPADYPEFGVKHPVDNLLELDAETRSWLDANATSWTRRVMFAPRVIKGYDAMRVRAFGVDEVTDESVFPRDDWNVEGEMPRAGTREVLVSKGVARVLEIKVGDALVFETRTAGGALNALELTVSGIVTTMNPIVDAVGVMLTSSLVDTLVRPNGRFSHLAIRLKDRRDAEAAAAELRTILGDKASVKTWWDESKGLVEIQGLRRNMLDIIALALLAIAAVGIANTILMAAYERVREIGTLRAMGMTRQGVVGLFVAEGLVMGVVGSAIGGALGHLTVAKYARDGIDFSALVEQQGQGYSDIPFKAVIYMVNDPPTTIVAMCIGLLIAVAASIYPAMLASRMLPADAVRAE